MIPVAAVTEEQVRGGNFTVGSALTEGEALDVYRASSVPAEVRAETQLDGRLAYRAAKRAFDVAASAVAALVFCWLLAGAAVAVKATSPGPALFKQRRVGKGKKLFTIYKFRTMRVDTPDLPSHLIDAGDWMTPIGPFLRKYSIDELPQLLNVFRGDMSFVGPRPALWSQFDLVAERDQYGANDVTPGLTGWAQINGRDELSVHDKAVLDGEYVRRRGLGFDAKCLFGTLGKLSGDEVVEGVGAQAQSADATDGRVR